MLRDSPYIIGLIIVLFTVMTLGGIWYITDINENSAVATLNETLRATAISEVDLSSRVEPGQVYLNQDGHAKIVASKGSDDADFESQLLRRIENELPAGSIARIDYALVEETTDTHATAYEMYQDDNGVMQWKKWEVKDDFGQPVSGTYDVIEPISIGVPIEGVRIRIRKYDDTAVTKIDDQTDADFWSYQSTVGVNRSEKVIDKYNLKGD